MHRLQPAKISQMTNSRPMQSTQPMRSSNGSSPLHLRNPIGSRTARQQLGPIRNNSNHNNSNHNNSNHNNSNQSDGNHSRSSNRRRLQMQLATNDPMRSRRRTTVLLL